MENSLDAAESIQELPELTITIDEISEEDLMSLKGGKFTGERINKALYRDYQASTTSTASISKTLFRKINLFKMTPLETRKGQKVKDAGFLLSSIRG